VTLNAEEDWHDMPGETFADELRFLASALDNGPESKCYLHTQKQLLADETEAKSQAEAFLLDVLEAGGEGVIIRNPAGIWTPKRVAELLKYKPHDDDEGVVVGFTSGRETDKGSKLLGMIGALILNYKGKRLELAGLTDEERQFNDPIETEHARQNPGVDMPEDFQGKHFKVGDVVTFKYRELSDDGVPKEARYFRKPMPERQG
jgi:DNA ligase-1